MQSPHCNLLAQTNDALRIQQPSSLITGGDDSFALTLTKNSREFNFSALHATPSLADALRIGLFVLSHSCLMSSIFSYFYLELYRKLSVATSSLLVAVSVLISPHAGAMAADSNNNVDM